MNLTKRTKLSLCQFLGIFEKGVNHVLLNKYSINIYYYDQISISDALLDSNQESISNLIDEIIQTKGELRSNISPKVRFDERFSDLEKCLLLDGYMIEKNEKKIISIEPIIEATQPIEDDLTSEIKKSNLNNPESIVSLINASANAFKNANPKYNECLTNARTALETLVKEITISRGGADESWGRALHFLKEVKFVTQREENAFASTYTFISKGSHVPLGFTEEEFARYGRNLTMSVCYFLIKKYNGE